MKIYEGLAHAFAAEGVEQIFCLLGDGNMHWASHLARLPGVSAVQVRHEQTACAMAMGYNSATGKVGVATVTCGPGFTQIMTQLATAARGRIPLVVFAGEAPLGAKYHLQFIDQQPFAAACGAHYISAHTASQMNRYVRDAFYIAKFERKPVVIGVPYDLQQQQMPELGAYQSSSDLIPPKTPLPPDAAQLDQIAALLLNAKCPIVVSGRGVMWSNAAADVEQVADRSGALLATTLRARGLHDHHPFSIGVAGGFCRAIAGEMGRKADVVVAIGASLNLFTLHGGAMFPNAKIVQIDAEPLGLSSGVRPAHIFVQGDAKLAAAGLLERVTKNAGRKAEIRTSELAARIKSEPADDARFPIEPGLIDPRDIYQSLESIVPKDFDVVGGSGHQAYFHTVMRGYDPRRYHTIRDFGAIGDALSHAAGVAAARQNGRVVLFEGDGSLLMHLQELESIKRHGLKLLVVCCNDGAYGSELHKYRADGLDESDSVFGRPDFASIFKGFGLRGATVTDVAQFGPLMENYLRHGDTEIWNVHVSDKVVSPQMRATVGKH